MRHNYIRGLKTISTRMLLPPSPKQSKTRPRWLGNFIWWLAFKIKAATWEEITQEVVTYGPLDALPLREAILSLINGSYIDHRDLENSIVIMGAKEFAELVKTSIPNQELNFISEDYHTNRTIFGVKVRVIPWLEGIALI